MLQKRGITPSTEMSYGYQRDHHTRTRIRGESMKFRLELNGNVSPEEIVRLRESVGWDTKGDYNKILANSLFHVLAREGEALVGFVNIAGGEAGDCLIYDLCVHPGYQRNGIATLMIKEVIDQCHNLDIQGINVLFEEKNRVLFEQLGFRMMGGGYIDLKSSDPNRIEGNT